MLYKSIIVLACLILSTIIRSENLSKAPIDGLQQDIDSISMLGEPLSNISTAHYVHATQSFSQLSQQLGLTPQELIQRGNLSQSLIFPRGIHVQLAQPPSLKLPTRMKMAEVGEAESLTSITNSYGLVASDLISYNPKINLLIPLRSVISWSDVQEELFSDEPLAQLSKRVNVSQQQILMDNSALHSLPLVAGSKYLLPPQSDFPDVMVLTQYQINKPISLADLKSAIGGTYADWIEANPKILDYTFSVGAFYSLPGQWYYHADGTYITAQLASKQSLDELAAIINMPARMLTHHGGSSYRLNLDNLVAPLHKTSEIVAAVRKSIARQLAQQEKSSLLLLFQQQQEQASQIMSRWNDDHYTIQLIAVRKIQSIQPIISPLSNFRPPVMHVTLMKQNKAMHVLITGAFSSYEKAQAAVKKLPTNALRKGAWIRKVSGIKKELEISLTSL
jgi:hypothetical protein